MVVITVMVMFMFTVMMMLMVMITTNINDYRLKITNMMHFLLDLSLRVK